MINFDEQEVKFFRHYLYEHIEDCENMTYCVSKENCKLLGVYENWDWYETLLNKIEKKNTDPYTDEELDFMIDYCNKHIGDCADMECGLSEESLKELHVYERWNWYEALRNKLKAAKEVKVTNEN